MINFLNFMKSKGNEEKFVVIKIDGGICSQIAFCVLGLYMQDLGYKVKYDLSWFKEYGLDCNKKFVRNYDMKSAFPDLNFEIASQEEVEHCKKINVFNDAIPKKGESGYLCGYAEERNKIFEYRDIFINNFKPIDLNTCYDVLDEIKNCQSCGVHVRRGDLAIKMGRTKAI